MDNNESLLKELKNGDITARDRLFCENMGLVRSVVKRFSFCGVESEDLIQTGSMGLLKAIDRFDSSFGVRFSTYAVPMIIGEIRRFLRDDGILKVSRHIREAAYKGYAVREKLSGELGREPTLEEISAVSGLSKEELLEAFEATAPVESINKRMYDDSDVEIAQSLGTCDNESSIVDKIFVENILESLDTRERQILVLRYFKGKTQQEIAREVGVSQVQVSRIEKKVLERIRRTQLA